MPTGPNTNVWQHYYPPTTGNTTISPVYDVGAMLAQVQHQLMLVQQELAKVATVQQSINSLRSEFETLAVVMNTLSDKLMERLDELEREPKVGYRCPECEVVKGAGAFADDDYLCKDCRGQV